VAGAFDAKVEISTADAASGLKALRKEIKGTGESLVELDKIIKAGKQNIVLIVQQFTKLVAEQTKAAAAANALAKADINAARAAGIRNVADSKTAVNAADAAKKDAEKTRATEQGNLAVARRTDVETRGAIATDRHAASTRRAAAAQLEMHDSLSNSRYLMYDVGATYGVIATGLLAIPAATAAVAAAYQKDFAQVIRVTDQMNDSQHQGLKDSLKSMATDMPIAFDELSRITQLGAQMGVLDDKLSGFTETTAKFVAVTGISADAGAQLFGRLETSFTADVEKFPDFFERVGSSIAYVGAKTVATDPEIASMLNQIGPLGAAAGMSAANVTGLAAALASVRVQPELARGTLTRVFGQLNRDVAEGAPVMGEFGKLMGITGDQASKLWKTDSSKFFTSLIKGLNETQAKNGELTTTFDKLGITASRDVSALTKLAVGYDVLDLSMTAANKGFKDGTALNDMSKVTFDTLVAKLTEMANAWKNLGDTLGSGALAPLAIFVDMAKNLAIGIDSLVKQVPQIGWVIQALMGIATVTALFLGFKAAQAFVMAGMIGFQQAAGRGMGSGLALGNMMKTLAQTMLMAKGATDQQSRALLEQVGATRALLIANTTTAAQLKSGAAGSFGVLSTASGKATTSLKGFGSSLLGLVGGPIGLMLGAAALLVGSFISMQVEAQNAGEAIADGMAQGSEAGSRAAVEALGNIKVHIADGVIALGSLDKKFVEIARDAGVPFEKLSEAAKKGKDAGKAVNDLLDEVARSKGFKDAAEIVNSLKPEDMALAAQFGFLRTKVKEVGEASVTAKKNADDLGKAAPKAGAAIKDMGDDADDAVTPLDKMTKALKDLNDEVFGTINAEAALSASLDRIGEGLQKSQSYSVNSEGGRDNIKNFEDTLTKARDYYTQLMTEGTLSAEEAATGYSQFIQGLVNEIRTYGGDTSYVEQLAAQTKEKFTAAIGGQPVMIPVATNPTQAQAAASNAKTLIQGWMDRNKADVKFGADTSGVDANLRILAGNIAKITGYPYEVVMDAMTDPASAKAQEIEKVLLSITDGTYTASVDADTTAAITNVQNFIAYARTELSHLQTELNGKVGYGDGEGSLGTAQKNQYAAIIAPAPVKAAPKQVRARTTTKQTSFLPELKGVTDGYDKAAEAAKKAGEAGKKAGKDMADGISDAVRAAEDFGSRLKAGLMSAYNQQYGLTTATDAYHSSLNAINKKRADEIAQVSDLRDRIRELNNERDKELISANKAKIEQGISVKYGETDRAADYGLQAKTAMDNAAAKQKDIDATNKQANELQVGIGALTGYSDAAIANRAALRDLEVKMIDMVAAYAATGKSQEQVRTYAMGLTSQFQRDVGQIGFNMAAVAGLQGNLERYIGVVASVPRTKPTDVELNGVDEAMQELAAYGDAADKATKDRVTNVETRVTYGIRKDPAGDRVGGEKDKNGNWVGGEQIWETYNTATGGTTGIQFFNKGGMVPGQSPADPTVDNMMAQVDGKGLIKVRSREFIQPEEAVDYYGPDFMEAVRTMSLPKFNTGGSPGGHGSGGGFGLPAIVGLDAETLAFMASLKQDIKLFADTRELASTVNAGNRQIAAEGGNH
jgi:TP901 family phage tail tape measure protein